MSTPAVCEKRPRFPAVFAIVIALSLSAFAATGCGQSDAEKVAVAKRAKEAKERKKQAADYATCKEVMSDFLDSLGDLDSDLSVGINVSEYGNSVRDARRDYERLTNDGDFGGLDCLSDVAVPAEKALNYHVKAYNAWNDCVSDYDCDDSSIDTRRQRLWRNATKQSDNAREGLNDMQPESADIDSDEQ